MRRMQDIWQDYDRKFQDQFAGRMGLAAFQEVIPMVLMGVSHEVIKLGLHPRYHAHLDQHWYGSLIPSHPLHPLRSAVHATARDWTIAATAQFSAPLQQKLQWVDDTVYPWVATLVDRRAADIDRFIDFVTRARRQ